MLRRLFRSTLFGVAVTAAVTVPSTASAQAFYFTSCATAGVCGFVEAIFTASVLTVQVSNMDAKFGSALFSAQMIFAGALGAATPGAALSASSTATTSGAVASIGTTSPWTFSTTGGSTELDLASFGNTNTFIEGAAASPFRAKPGDPDNGTWVTKKNGFVEFTADLSGISGVTPGQLVGFGFCTDQDCASGQALVVTPEPATLTLFATGLLGIVAVRRRRKTG